MTGPFTLLLSLVRLTFFLLASAEHELSVSFACSHVHTLPYCPTMAYTIPLLPPPQHLHTTR